MKESKNERIKESKKRKKKKQTQNQSVAAGGVAALPSDVVSNRSSGKHPCHASIVSPAHSRRVGEHPQQVHTRHARTIEVTGRR
jgi:hypothetical protein